MQISNNRIYFGANQHKKILEHFVSAMTYPWFTMTNEHWRGFTQIDASFCLELNMFEVSQGVLIFYNIYLSQPSHLFLTNQMKGFVSIF